MAQDERVTLIIQAKDRASRVLSTLDNRLGRIGFAAAGAAAALGTAAIAAGSLLARSTLEAASSAENLRLRLDALLGSTEEGGRAFQQLADFASTVPFEFEEIIQSSAQLAGIVKGGADEIASLLPLIADLAAVSGLTLEQTTQQVVRMFSAGAGSADLFRERGINAMLGFQAGVQVSADETRRRLIEAWEDPESKFRGASGRMANTWTGLLSMMSDRWFQFRLKIADAGFFDRAKEALREMLDRITQLADSGALDAVATMLGERLAEGIEFATEKLSDFADAAATNGDVWLAWAKLILVSIRQVGVGFFKLVQIAFNAGQLIGNAFAAGAAVLVRTFGEVLNRAIVEPINRRVLEPINKLRELVGNEPIKLIPEIDVSGVDQYIDTQAEAFRANASQLADATRDLLAADEPIRDAAVELLVAQAQAAGRAAAGISEAAKNASDRIRATLSGSGSASGGLSEDALKLIEKFEAQLAAIQQRAQILGPEYDVLGERVRAYTSFINAATEQGINLDTQLSGNLGTLRDVARAYLDTQGAINSSNAAAQRWQGTMELAQQAIQASIPVREQLLAQQFALVQAFLNGRVAAEDFARAMEYLRKAMEEGVQGGVNSVKDVVATARPQMARLGRLLITGIGQGMADAKDILVSILTSIIDGLISLGISKLKIFSPSRVTHEWGVYLVEGMARGLESQQSRLAATWQQTLGLITPPDGISLGLNGGLTLAGAGATSVSSVAAPDRKPMKLQLEGPDLPPAPNPLAAARDRDWQRFYRNTVIVAREDGFHG